MAQNTPGVAARDEIVRPSRRFGRMNWKRWSGYHQRSKVETKMHCVKLLGERIMARGFDSLRLRQSKTTMAVEVLGGAPRKATLQKTLDRYRSDNMPILETILATERGTAWTEGRFRASWRKACIKTGVSGVTFHDLRGTAVTRLALAGATVPEIAAITGHSLREVGNILDTHYMHRDPALGAAAIRKLAQSCSVK